MSWKLPSSPAVPSTREANGKKRSFLRTARGTPDGDDALTRFGGFLRTENTRARADDKARYEHRIAKLRADYDRSADQLAQAAELWLDAATFAPRAGSDCPERGRLMHLVLLMNGQVRHYQAHAPPRRVHWKRRALGVSLVELI